MASTVSKYSRISMFNYSRAEVPTPVPDCCLLGTGLHSRRRVDASQGGGPGWCLMPPQLEPILRGPCRPTSAMMVHGFQSSSPSSPGSWRLPRLTSWGRQMWEVSQWTAPASPLPEMMFGDNILRIQHGSGFGIEFNTTDALRCVNSYQGMLKVACQDGRWTFQGSY